ncbi:MAG: hypothetical protein MUC38_13420 [Cyclobacteriaceae bacterium]|jgi:hypothetical protein|nr:hypothetical protein [Cyclobacteriaceae bacterium]
MKYYTIGFTDELSIIGAYPQVTKEDGYNLSSFDSYWNVSWDKIPDFAPSYHVKINDNAKPTNLLRGLSGFYGFTVDLALKSLLIKFNLPPSKFYPIHVTYHGKNLEYYWFHFVNSLLDYIDYNGTTFELFEKSPFKLLRKINVSSVTELHELQEGLTFERGIRLKVLTLKNDFPKYDIISLWNITPLFLVSESLKTALEESGLNGFTFREYEPLLSS